MENVAPEGLIAADAKVSDPASGRSLRYAELARGKTLAQNSARGRSCHTGGAMEDCRKPVPKVDDRCFRYRPSPVTRRTLRPPGCSMAKSSRPTRSAQRSFPCDDSAAKAMAGVAIVRDGDFIGAAAPSEREAQNAVAAITRMKEVKQISNKELFAYLKERPPAVPKLAIANQKGSWTTASASAAHRLDGRTQLPISRTPRSNRVPLLPSGPAGN